MDLSVLCSNVLDPDSLNPDPDPSFCQFRIQSESSPNLDPTPSVVDPLIRTTDLRIRILFFSSVADKMPTKIKFS